MTAGKIQIMPYKYNLRCSVPGCKNKGDFEIKRRPGNLMIMCEACMCGINEFVKDIEAAKAEISEMPTETEATAESVEETTETVQETEATEAPKPSKRTRSRKEK